MGHSATRLASFACRVRGRVLRRRAEWRARETPQGRWSDDDYCRLFEPRCSRRCAERFRSASKAMGLTPAELVTAISVAHEDGKHAAGTITPGAASAPHVQCARATQSSCGVRGSVFVMVSSYAATLMLGNVHCIRHNHAALLTESTDGDGGGVSRQGMAQLSMREEVLDHTMSRTVG